jgi:hypothetical protein
MLHCVRRKSANTGSSLWSTDGQVYDALLTFVIRDPMVRDRRNSAIAGVDSLRHLVHNLDARCISPMSALKMAVPADGV